MLYIPVALVLGALVGLLRGGRLANAAHATFRLPMLLVVGSALQLAALAPAVEAYANYVIVGSYALLLAFAVANLAHRAMAVVAVGIALNALVITINGGMPVKAEAIVAAGLAETVTETKQLEFRGKRHLATSRDRLVVLGDIIPVPVGGGAVLSYGDLVLALGAAAVTASLVAPRRSPSIAS